MPYLQGSNIGGEFIGSFLNAVKSGVQPLAEGIATIDPVSRNLRQQADASRLQAQQRLTTGARSRPQDAKRLLGIAQQIGQQPTAQEQFASTLPTNAQVLGSGAKTAGYIFSGGLGAGNLLATAGLSLGLGQLGRQQGETFSQAGGRTFGEILPYSGLAQQVTTPLISSGLLRFVPSATSGGLLGRFAQGGANVFEGGALNLSTGQALSPSQTAIDFITGAAGRPFSPTTRNVSKFRMDQNTIDELVRADRMINNPSEFFGVVVTGAPNKKAALKAIQKQGYDTIDRLAGKYLPDKELNRIKNPKKIAEKLFELNRTNGLANVPTASLLGGQSAKNFKNERQFSALTDKLPRFEIDDSGAKITPPRKVSTEKSQHISKLLTSSDEAIEKARQLVGFDGPLEDYRKKLAKDLYNEVADLSKGDFKLSNILDHEKLYKQYPQLKNVDVGFTTKHISGAKASFDPSVNLITINQELASNPQQLKSTLLHEIQHAIQQKEGFARGGNLNTVNNFSTQELETINEVSSLLKQVKDTPTPLYNVGISNAKQEVKDWAINIIRAGEKDIDEFINNTPFNQYKRLSGELEARAVQRRMDLPANQRAGIDPYAEEAIATTGKADPSEFINRFDSELNEAASRGSVVAKEAQELSKQIQQNTQSPEQLTRTLADSTTEIGKDFRNAINRTDIKASEKVNIIDYMRTPNRVLQKIGLGKEAQLLKDKYRDYLLDLPKEINKVTEWSKRAPDTQKVFRALDGQEVALNANEKAVVGEIRDYLKNWADKLGLPEDKRIANYITHIFEDDLIQKEFDPALARLIQDKIPGSVYDPFLQKRLGALGYKEDAYQALDAYVKRGTRKFHMDQALGPLKKAAENLDVESEKYVKRLADRVNLRPTEVDNLIDNFIKSTPIGYKFSARPTANITRKVRQAVYRGTLGLNAGSALRNLTQGVNTYAKLGERYTIKGYIDFLTKGTKELQEVGALADNIIQDRSPSATKKLWENIDKGLFAFFEGVEKLNRGAAYYGAKAKAINQGLDEQQAIKAGIKAVEDTQFTFGSVDTPVALQSDLVKSLTQFQSFNVKQTEFISEMIKNKELGGLLRFAGANMLVLASVGKLIGLEPKDVIPFSDVLTGESRIGQTPPIQAGSAALKSVFGDEETRQQGRKDLQRVIPAFIPGGVQTRKTIEGLGAFNEGASFTPSGKKRFDIEQTPSNALRAGILGQYNTPEGREYIKNIGKAKSEILHNELKQLSPEEANARYRQIKKENPALANQIKKRVTFDKLNATNRERDIAKITYVDGRVREVTKELKKLNTREEKNALIKRYKTLGIATDAVIAEIKQMIKDGKLE